MKAYNKNTERFVFKNIDAVIKYREDGKTN